MSEELTPQFYTPDAKGDSQSVYRVLAENSEMLQESTIKARNRQSYSSVPGNSVAMDGMPGVPFERGTPNPDLFYQGEDVVYDMYLFYDGKPVSFEDYDITVSVKPSSRAYTTTWQGVLDNGVYKANNATGYYELWIPSSATAALYAGTYHLHVQLQERVGSGQGRFDRKYVILQTYFNLEYSNFSENPESSSPLSTSSLQRSAIEQTWPNKPNTVGRNPALGSTSVPIQPGWDPMSIQ